MMSEKMCGKERANGGFTGVLAAVIAALVVGIVILAYIFWKPSKEVQDRRAQALYEQAVVAEMNHNDRAAFVLYKKIAYRLPDSDLAPEALFKYGIMEVRIFGRDVRARKAFERLRKRYPTSSYAANALEGLASVYYRSTKPEDKKKLIDVNEQIISQPANATDLDWQHITNMETYWKMGQHDLAYREALRIKDRSAKRVQWNLYYQQLMVQYNPNDPKNYLGLAAAYEYLGFPDKARYYRQEAVRRGAKVPKAVPASKPASGARKPASKTPR